MLRNKYIEEEIWRLKNQDKPILKQETVPPNLIDTPIDQRNLKDERVFRLASESAAEEAEMDFNSLLEEYRDWKKKNKKGNWQDFLKAKDDVKLIKISKILTDRIFAGHGGKIGELGSAGEKYEFKIKELMDRGLSRELAEVIVKSGISEENYEIMDKAKGGRVRLSSGGILSRDTLISMLRNEYPSEYIKLSESGFDKVSTKEISQKSLQV